MMFIRIIKDILTNFKLKEKRRPSGSKSMAKLINNVFGKRRKSVQQTCNPRGFIILDSFGYLHDIKFTLCMQLKNNSFRDMK